MNVTNAAAYALNQCTWGVANLLTWVPTGLGNAYEWLTNARAKGLMTGGAPRVGSVAVFSQSYPNSDGFGHVGVVTAVDSLGYPTITEMNAYRDGGGYGKYDSYKLTNNDLAYVEGYIYPPNSYTGASAGSQSAASGTLASATTAGWSFGPFNQDTPGIGGLGDVVQTIGGLPGAVIGGITSTIGNVVGGVLTFFAKGFEIILGFGALTLGIFILVKHTDAGGNVINIASQAVKGAAMRGV